MITFAATWIPVFNIVLGMIGFLWLLGRTANRRSEYPREVLGALLVLAAFVAALLEITAEQMARDEPVSLTVFVIAGVKICLLAWLYRSRNSLYRTGQRHDGGVTDNLDEVEVNRDIFARRRRTTRTR